MKMKVGCVVLRCTEAETFGVLPTTAKSLYNATDHPRMLEIHTKLVATKST